MRVATRSSHCTPQIQGLGDITHFDRGPPIEIGDGSGYPTNPVPPPSRHAENIDSTAEFCLGRGRPRHCIESRSIETAVE